MDQGFSFCHLFHLHLSPMVARDPFFFYFLFLSPLISNRSIKQWYLQTGLQNSGQKNLANSACCILTRNVQAFKLCMTCGRISKCLRPLTSDLTNKAQPHKESNSAAISCSWKCGHVSVDRLPGTFEGSKVLDALQTKLTPQESKEFCCAFSYPELAHPLWWASLKEHEQAQKKNHDIICRRSTLKVTSGFSPHDCTSHLTSRETSLSSHMGCPAHPSGRLLHYVARISRDQRTHAAKKSDHHWAAKSLPCMMPLSAWSLGNRREGGCKSQVTPAALLSALEM